MTTQRGVKVNIILVRAPFRSSGGSKERELVDKYRDHILFLGISSFEDFPLDAMNPFSGRIADDEYTGLFPGMIYIYYKFI